MPTPARRRPGPGKGATYRKRAEIERAMTDAAIDLAMHEAPESITAGGLAERAGVSPAYVSRYGGGLRALLMNAARQVIMVELDDWSPGTALANPRVAAAVRLVAFLIVSGTPAEAIFGEGFPLLTRIAGTLGQHYSLDEVDSQLGARIALVFFLGYRAFGEASGLTEADALAFVGHFDRLLRDVAAGTVELGRPRTID